MFQKIIAWFKEYDDEITWFLIGSMFADGTNELAKQNHPLGFLCLFVSVTLWYLYMKQLKSRK